MNLFLLTASHDQHVGFRFSVEYVIRAVRELSGVEVGWIIADDGEHAVFEMPWWDETCGMLVDAGIQVVTLRRKFSKGGVKSFVGNMRELATTVLQIAKKEDVAAVIEDDWLHKHYLRNGYRVMESYESLRLWGETRTRYYRVTNRRHHTFRPNGRAALAATMFRARWGAESIRAWADRETPTIMLDDVLWRRTAIADGDRILKPQSTYVVGIKGLPGTKGLGIGGDLGENHGHDPDGTLLREWIGEDADRYLPFAN